MSSGSSPRPSVDWLGVVLNALVLLAGPLVLLVIVLVFGAVTAMFTSGRVAEDMSSFALFFGCPALVALVVGVVGLALSIRPPQARPRVGRMLAAAGVLLGLLPFCIATAYVGSADTRTQEERDGWERLRVHDTSAIGRSCTTTEASPLHGDCPQGYTCTRGAQGQPQRPTPSCQILCWGSDDYCGGDTRCVDGVCQP